jgi:hypothetical protein
MARRRATAADQLAVLRSGQDTARQRGCGGHMAPGGEGPLTGSPRVEETATDGWAHSYLISIRNKCQKMNSPPEKYLGWGKNS